jgi:hypothetical protein
MLLPVSMDSPVPLNLQGLQRAAQVPLFKSPLIYTLRNLRNPVYEFALDLILLATRASIQGPSLGGFGC